MTEDLELEAALLAAELDQLDRELAAGYAVPGKRRPFPHELRARVRFAELDRLVNEAAQLAARKAGNVRTGILDALEELTRTAGDLEGPFAALEHLRALADPTTGTALPGLRKLVDDTARELERDLTRTARAAGREVLDEAIAQGLPARILPAEVPLGDSFTTEAIRAAARQVAQAPVNRLLTVALDAGRTASLRPDADAHSVILDALDAAESASTAGTDDLARQAASTAHGLGRRAGARVAPTPRQVYASELLDGVTCGPCAAVDGRTYATLEAALADYPGAAGFVFCDGGRRCRGTLVYVWTDEATPTDGPPPAQGPSDPPPDRPRPIPPDDRTIEAIRAASMPPAPTPPATPPAVAPPAEPVDPELGQLGDAAIETRLRTATAAGRTDEAYRLADELDRRASLGREWVDPDAEAWDVGPMLSAEEDAAEAARIAAAMEDAAPDLVDLGLSSSTGGRRIDRVREDFTAEQYRRMIAADEAGAGIRPDRLEEFRAKYGDNAYEDVIWRGPARTAYYYANEELRRVWQTSPRLSFAEYAEAAGIRDAKTLARAKAAREARDDAARRAEEGGTGRDLERKRAKDAERRRRRDNSAGAQLERERRRMEKAQRAAQDAEERIRRAGGTIDPGTQ